MFVLSLTMFSPTPFSVWSLVRRAITLLITPSLTTPASHKPNKQPAHGAITRDNPKNTLSRPQAHRVVKRRQKRGLIEQVVTPFSHCTDPLGQTHTTNNAHYSKNNALLRSHDKYPLSHVTHLLK